MNEAGVVERSMREGGAAAPPGPGAVAALPSPVPQLDRVTFGGLLVFALFLSRIAMAQIALGTAFVSWLLRRWLAPSERLVVPRAALPAAAFAALTVVSCLLSSDPGRSLPRVREFVLYGILFLVPNALRTRRQVEALLHAIMASSLVLSVWGIVQYALGEGGTEHRISGPLSHWMTFAGLVTFSASLAMAYAAYHPCPRRRLAYAAVALLNGVTLALSLTRGAYLAVIAALALLLFLRKPAALVLLPVVLGGAFLVAPADVRSRVLSSLSGHDDTTVDRFYLWGSGLEMIADRPLFGLGLSRVNVAYADYRDPKAPKLQNTHLHDNLLQIAAERGLPALACWIWFFAVLGRDVVRSFRDADATRKPAAAGVLLAFVAFHVIGIGEYNFGDSEILMAMLLLCSVPKVLESLPGEGAAPAAAPGTPAP